MPEGISSRPPNPNVEQPVPPEGQGAGQPQGPKPEEGAQQAADQVRAEAQAKAQAEAAAKAAQQMTTDSATLTLPQDFMGVLDSIVKEGFETAKPPQGGMAGDQGAEGGMGQKDLATLREFLREAKYLVENQGMTVAQMFNMIKVEQGGAFWQKLQQVLQKGLQSEKGFSQQKGDSGDGGGLGVDGALKGLTAGAALSDSMKTPGRAILELLKGEINPQNQTDSFLAALALLKKDGLNDSAHRLRSYLRRRGGVPQEALIHFSERREREAPVPLFNREPIQPVNWWYLLMALGCFGASMGLGLNILEATLVGIGVAALMFFLSFIYKR